MKALWKKIRHRIEWVALEVALALVPLLSRDACYRVGGVLGSFAAFLDHRGRRVSLANLEVVFRDELSPARRDAIVRESYQHFARTLLDLLWSPRLNDETLASCVEFEGLERMHADVGPSRNCIVGAFHYGNFELLSLAMAWAGYPGAIATEGFKNPLFDEPFAKLRQSTGHHIVERKGAIIRLYKTLARKGRVALLVDTTLPPQQPTVVIECFGLKTIVTVAHAWLQERTGAPIIPMHCESLGGGRYRVVSHPKVQLPEGATHRDIAQACWDALEPVVRRNPAPWLWMYKHWRYQPDGATGYPFYAQPSWAFEQVASRADYAKLDRARSGRRRAHAESPQAAR